MKKVAICFWGQTRTFSTLSEYFKLKHDNIKFDYFISTWDDFEDKFNFDSFQGKNL